MTAKGESELAAILRELARAINHLASATKARRQAPSELGRQSYLTGAEAADYLRFPGVAEFRAWARQHDIYSYSHLGKSFYRRPELDRALKNIRRRLSEGDGL